MPHPPALCAAIRTQMCEEIAGAVRPWSVSDRRLTSGGRP